MDKKFVMGIAAMAALTLVSCSSDDLDSFSDNSSKNEAISFDGYLGRSAVAVNGTRGSEETVSTLKTNGFGVFGTYTPTDGQASNLFDNQKVTYFTSTTPTESKWTYSPLKFWPANGKIDFLAYAPYDKSTKLTEGSKIKDFTVDEDIAKQKDLLWTNDMNHQITGNITTAKEKVKFQFHHALSRLGYTVTLSGDYSSSGATFTVNKITLAGSPDGTSKKAFYKTGTIDLSKIVTKDNTEQNKKDLSKTNTETGLWKAESSDGNKQNFDLVSSAQTLDQTGIKSGDNYLFVIPQDFSQTKTEGGSDVDELYVYVEYTINYGGTTGSVTNKVYKQIKKHFLQGNAYMLNLTLGLPIEFDVDVTGGVNAGVDGWGTDEGINIGSNDTPWERK